jgi:phosphoglucomutase
MRKIIEEKLKIIERKINEFKDEKWKIQQQMNEEEIRVHLLKTFESEKEYKRRIEKVFIDLIKLIAKRDILNDVLHAKSEEVKK